MNHPKITRGGFLASLGTMMMGVIVAQFASFGLPDTSAKKSANSYGNNTYGGTKA